MRHSTESIVKLGFHVCQYKCIVFHSRTEKESKLQQNSRPTHQNGYASNGLWVPFVPCVPCVGILVLLYIRDRIGVVLIQEESFRKKQLMFDENKDAHKMHR